MTVKIDGTNTVANPAFTGADTDTGLQVGTDELKLVTGGTERVVVNSSGDVGIGTSSPSSYSSSANELVVAGTTSPGITIAGSSGNTGTIMFADGTSGSEVYRGQIDYQHASDSMVFFTNGGSERMRIDSSGNVGIGTSSPSEKLAVDGNILLPTAGQYVKITAGNTQESGLLAINTNGDERAGINFQGVNTGQTTAITLSTSDTTTTMSERMRIDSSGKLNIGVSSSGNNNSAKVFVNNTDSSEHTSLLSKGNFSTTQGVYFEAKGKYGIRGTSDINIDLVQAIDAWTNTHTVVTFEFLVTCAVNDKAAKITGYAGFHRTGGGNFTYYTSTPSITMLSGSGIGAGSLSWTGGTGANDKILRYTTAAGTSYVKYVITDLKATGHDYATVNIL